MVPVAEHFAAYHVETNAGTEIVPEDVCGAIVDVDDEGETGQLAQYCEGSRIESVERKVGWYARLSAPGYLDCTGWDGPHATADEALAIAIAGDDNEPALCHACETAGCSAEGDQECDAPHAYCAADSGYDDVDGKCTVCGEAF